MFVGLSETWLHKGHTEAELQIEDFTLFRCDSSRQKKNRGRHTGGVCFYVRKTLVHHLKNFTLSLRKLFSSFVFTQKFKILFYWWFTVNQTIEANDFITPHNGLKLAISSLETTPNIIFGGDFNLPKAVWPSGLPKPGCSLDERIVLNSLNQFCNDYLISQYVNTPTHKDGNILDLVFTNNENIIHNCAIIPVLQSTSHHKIVMVSTCLNVNAISGQR